MDSFHTSSCGDSPDLVPLPGLIPTWPLHTTLASAKGTLAAQTSSANMTRVQAWEELVWCQVLLEPVALGMSTGCPAQG